jgi:hypothetical protein
VNNADAPSTRSLAFVPKDTVNVVIGKQSANIYPKIEPMWNVEERAYAFHVASTALKNLHLTAYVYVDAMGVFLDSQTVVASLKADFYNHFEDHWLDFAHLQILSFHNTAGGSVAGATIPADTSVLKPVQNGVIADCHPADVHYVRVQLTLNFTDLATGAGPNNNTTLHC